jgi:hypothetical protein
LRPRRQYDQGLVHDRHALAFGIQAAAAGELAVILKTGVS